MKTRRRLLIGCIVFLVLCIGFSVSISYISRIGTDYYFAYGNLCRKETVRSFTLLPLNQWGFGTEQYSPLSGIGQEDVTVHRYAIFAIKESVTVHIIANDYQGPSRLEPIHMPTFK